MAHLLLCPKLESLSSASSPAAAVVILAVAVAIAMVVVVLVVVLDVALCCECRNTDIKWGKTRAGRGCCCSGSCLYIHATILKAIFWFIWISHLSLQWFSRNHWRILWRAITKVLSLEDVWGRSLIWGKLWKNNPVKQKLKVLVVKCNRMFWAVHILQLMQVFCYWQQLITARDDKTGLETQINRLQHKLKDVNDDFKSRLQKYVKDIAVSPAYPQRNYRIDQGFTFCHWLHNICIMQT